MWRLTEHHVGKGYALELWSIDRESAARRSLIRKTRRAPSTVGSDFPSIFDCRMGQKLLGRKLDFWAKDRMDLCSLGRLCP